MAILLKLSLKIGTEGRSPNFLVVLITKHKGTIKKITDQFPLRRQMQEFSIRHLQNNQIQRPTTRQREESERHCNIQS